MQPSGPITIDQIRNESHRDYANLKILAEQVSKEFPASAVTSLSGQVRIDTVTPQPTELDLLLGVVAVLTPWAMFLTPDSLYGKKRRMRVPFGVSRILPSLGSHEYCELLQQTVLAHLCTMHEEEREKSALDNFFAMLQKLDTWQNDIFNRIHQFMHG